MVQFSSLFNGLTKSISIKNNGRRERIDVGREAADALAKEARKNDLILSSSGIVHGGEGSDNFASVFSKRGQKGMNQDCFVVWEEFGCQEDMIFCGIFDGHGPWGHLVSKRVRKLMPSSLLCNWQEILALNPLDFLDSDKDLETINLHLFDIWKQSYLKTFSAIDQDLEHHPSINSFHSGTTASTIVRQLFSTFFMHISEEFYKKLLLNVYFTEPLSKTQCPDRCAFDGDLLVMANVGDSRAVLATICDDGSLVPVQLTVDLKPNLPQEIERITQCKGRIFSADDEPGVYRVWLPNGEETARGPGLAVSRAFGDYYIKGFGLISEPEVTQRKITCRDQFAILATDGVWDVISNQQAVEIVSSTPGREESAKRLVQHAVRAWKRKRPGLAMDDISAICLFFHTSPSPSPSADPIKVP